MRCPIHLLPALLLAVVAGCGRGAPAETPAQALAFLDGTWVHDDGGFRTVESWRALPDGTLLGAGHASREGAMLFAETLAVIPRAGGAHAYVAWPTGGEPVLYTETARDRTSATFRNDQHDFPRVITYRRADPQTLEVTATGVTPQGEERVEWWVLRRS